MRSCMSGVKHGRRIVLSLNIRLIFALLLCVFILQSGKISASTLCDEARDHYARGVNLLSFPERKEAFAKAVELCPDYAEAHVNLADAYENLGDFDAAERHYAQAVSLGLQSPVPYIGLGEVYLRTGRYGLAKDYYAKGCNIEPGNERILAGQKIVDERLKREKFFLPVPRSRLAFRKTSSFA